MHPLCERLTIACFTRGRKRNSFQLFTYSLSPGYLLITPSRSKKTALAILPRHLLEGQDLTKSPLSRRPIGTGPYIFKEWRAGEKIALAYNPNYFEGRPYLNGYVYLVKPDTATMFMKEPDKPRYVQKHHEQFNEWREMRNIALWARERSE